jgi:chromosome segregation ATPase
MAVKTVIMNALKEVIVPELEKLKSDMSETKAVLGVTNKRIDDLSTHMAELSRRVDDTNKRIDELGKDLNRQISETNDRLNRLYEVITDKDYKELREMIIDEKIADIIAV